MKKSTFFIGLLAALMLFSACRKEDQYLLKKGYSLQGTLSPTFELPVSTGEVNFGQLLDKLGDSFSEYITDDEIITLRYHFDTLAYVEIGDAYSTPAPAHKAPMSTKDAVFTPVEDTIISFDFPLTFFDNVDLLSDADISIEKLLFKGQASIWTECPPSVVDDLQYIHADIDQLKVNYTKRDGTPGTPVLIEGAELHITDMTDENNTLPIPETNLADIFNEMPSYIGVSFRIVISVDEEGFVSSNISNISSFSELLDSLGMTRLAYKADVEATLPLELKIGALTYNYDVDIQKEYGVTEGATIFDQIDSSINKVLGEGAANIDSATLAVILRFNNGIPLDIIMNATALDIMDLPIFTLIQGEVIKSAETKPIPNQPGVSEAGNPVKSEMVAELNLAQAKQFLSAKTLRLKLGLKTTGDDSKAIKRSDNLGIQMLIRVNPNIKLEWDIPGLEDGVPFLSTF